MCFGIIFFIILTTVSLDATSVISQFIISYAALLNLLNICVKLDIFLRKSGKFGLAFYYAFQ